MLGELKLGDFGGTKVFDFRSLTVHVIINLHCFTSWRKHFLRLYLLANTG